MKLLKLLLYVSVPVSLIGCSGNGHDSCESARCGVNNPTEELSWLKDEVDNRQMDTSENANFRYIEQATVNNLPVFLFNNCNPAANVAISIYNCDGIYLGYIGDDNYPSKKIDNRKIIYKPSGFKCIVDGLIGDEINDCNP